jgi:predicted nucleic acid-binding protein
VAYYLDTSAAAKLVVEEPGSKALRSWLREQAAQIVSSDLLRTELLRATRRSAPEQMPQARAVLAALTLLSMSSATCDRAGSVDPRELRSLDALHLAVALELGDELEGLITYDVRQGAAARAFGIDVIAP